MDLTGCVTMEEMLSEAFLGSVPVFKQEIVKHGSNYRSKDAPSHLAQNSTIIAQTPLQQHQHQHNGCSIAQPCPAPPQMLYHTSPRQHQLSSLSASLRQETAHPTHPTINSDWVNLMTSVNLQHLDDSDSRFQYMLSAATSPAVKVDEEPVTYLNQGQSYELKFKQLSVPNGEHFLKSRVRIIFHERRLQYMEREQMEHWKAIRPGERILDIDIPISYGLVDLKIDSYHLNGFEFTWDSELDAAVYIKVNCISTEFTAKKHGGEKGVPFRLQVETYSLSSSAKEQLLHCASCQVKVFKPKGADRKHKTDREKIEKLSNIDRDKYQPSYEYTIMTEIPLDQVTQYLEQLRKQQETDLLNGSNIKEEHSLSLTDVKSCLYRPDVGGQQPVADSSSRSNENDCRSPQSNSLTPPGSTGSALLTESLSIYATAQEVAHWLCSNRFSGYVQTFQKFLGADILRLSREDLIQLCGPADGIRLNNALHLKRVRPRLTLHVYLEPVRSPARVPFSGAKANSISVSTSSGCWSPTSSNSPSSILSSLHSTRNVDADQASPGPLSPQQHCTSSVSDAGRFQRFLLSNKRTGAPDIENDKDTLSAKRRYLQLEDICHDLVFHAVHLEFLTKDHFTQQLACLFELQAKQVYELCLQTSSGIFIYISDSVIQNLSDLSRFVAEAKEDNKHPGRFRIVMKSLECL